MADPGGTSRDASGRTRGRASRRPTVRQRERQRLARLGEALLGLSTDFQTNLDLLTAAAGELLGASCALYNRLEGDRLRTAAAWSAPPGFIFDDDAHGHLCTDVVTRGDAGAPLVARDLERTPWAKSDPNVKRHGLSAYAGYPVRLPEGAIGSLCVVYDHDVEVADDDLRILQVVAAVIATEEQRRRAGRALASSELRFRALFESNPLMCFLVSADGTVLLANEAGGRELGYEPENLIGRPVFEVFHPDDREAARAHIVECLHEPSLSPHWELRKRRRDGSELWVSEHARAVVDDAGRPCAFVVCQDITERRRAADLQEAIYEISEAAHGAGDLPSLYAAIHRCIGRLMDARNFYIALYQRSEDIVTFDYFVDEMDERPAPGPPAHGMTAYVLRTGRAVLATPEVFSELQAEGEVENIGSPSIDWLGVPLIVGAETIGALVVQTYTEGVRYGPREEAILTYVSHRIADAIARAHAEAALRESEERYRSLVESMQDGVFLVTDGKIAFANRGLGAILGRSVEEIVGRPFESFVEIGDVERVRDLFAAQVRKGETREQAEIGCRHGGGTGSIRASLQIGPVSNASAPTVLCTLRDLTEHRRLEEQLRLSQRIESLGLLAGGVAHDFNNLLMAIIGSAELLSSRIGPGVDVIDEIDTIRRSGQRAAELTRGLLAFARRQVLEAAALDLNQVVDAVLPILRRVIPEHIGIEFVPCSRPVGMRGDRGQLDQVLMNLAVNSRDAMPEGGSITFSTDLVELGPEYCATRAWARPGQYAMVAVSDTGAGMSPEVSERVFEPFFTTKERGSGTGLGLSVVFGIVKQHDGMIDVDSAPGAGTTFRVYFPASAEPAEAAPYAGSGVVEGGAETILIVEDEEEVRRILVQALSTHGYRVLAAPDGVEALDLLRSGPHVDLVISDVVMPRMGGPELYRRTASLDPRPRFLFSSGYGDGLLDAGLLGSGDVGFLAKPYGIEELARRVRGLLDHRPPSGG